LHNHGVHTVYGVLISPCLAPDFRSSTLCLPVCGDETVQ